MVGGVLEVIGLANIKANSCPAKLTKVNLPSDGPDLKIGTDRECLLW